MSKDKHRAKRRRHAILREVTEYDGHLPVDRKGWISLRNPDLKRLLRDGVLKLIRPYVRGIRSNIRRTYVVPANPQEPSHDD